MPTLYLSPRYSDDSRLMWQAAHQNGWKTHRLASRHLPEDAERENVAFYGESLFAAYLAEQLRLRFIEPRPDWLPNLPLAYANRKIELTTLGAAKALDRMAFVKPADEKAFPAKPYAPRALRDGASSFDDSLLVLVSELVEFQAEYRLFVLDRAVTTASLYFRHGAIAQRVDGTWGRFPDEEAAALAFAAQVLADPGVFVPPAVVMDVGLTADRGWCVIECNPCWGSGIYGADPTKVLPLLRRSCVSVEEAATADPRFFVDR